MTSTNRRKPRRRRAETTIAGLTAVVALTGGAQALAPAPAVAVVNDGVACSGSFWLDQFVCIDQADGGGGGGSGNGGAGPAGGGGSGSGEQLPHETVVVVDPTKKPKATVGGPAVRPPHDPDSRPSREEGDRGGPRHSGSSKSESTGSSKREPAGYRCWVYGENLVFDSQAECDQMREKARRERKQACEELSDQILGYMRLPQDNWDNLGEKEVLRLFSLSDRWHARKCEDFEKRPGS